MNPAPLTFPSPEGCASPPVWTKNGFLVDGRHTPILSYDIGPVAWSDNLTDVHEEVAGDDHYIDRASREHAISQLKRWVNNTHAKVMDIGCSSGFLLHLLRSRFPDYTVIGADCVTGPLERLSRTVPDIPLLHFDLLKSPWPEDSFDALTLLNVLEHIEDDSAAMRQVHCMLKPGGVAVIELPAGPDLYDIYDRELMHFRRYRMSDLLRKLRAAGFEILDRSHLGFFLYPGFWLAKNRNQRYFDANAETKRELVKNNIASHRSSQALHTVMRLESRLRNIIYFPCGIRCLVTCRKRLV